MSSVIELQQVPNQRVSVELDGDRYVIDFNDIGNVTAATVTRNDEVLVSGQRVVAGTPILPYQYLESGNFIFITDDGELPVYTEFGGTQTLYYLTQAEVVAVRG